MGESSHAAQDIGARVVFGVLKQALADRLGPKEAEWEAARLLGHLSRCVMFCQRDLPNPLFAADLEAALVRVLDDPDVADACGTMRAGLMVASLLAALDEKWEFRLQIPWLRQQVDSPEGAGLLRAVDARWPRNSAGAAPPRPG